MYKKALSTRALVGLIAGLAVTFVGMPRAVAGDEAPAAAAKAPPTKKQKDAAKKAYGEGEKAYNSGNYAAALAAFQKANEAIHSPQADYWIAKSLDGENKTEEAIKAYESFLGDPDASKAGEAKMADAKVRLDALRATLNGEMVIDTNPLLGSIAVDGAPQPGEAPMTLKLTPGKHRITVSSPGYVTKDLDVDVKGGDKLKETVSLVREPPPVAPVAAVAAAPPPPPPPPPPEEKSMVPAYVTLGIAGGAAIVGTIFGVQALGSKSDYDKAPSTELADDTERSALIADMAFGVAITLGVTGIVLLTSDDEPPPAASGSLKPAAKPRFALTPYAGPKSGGARARLAF